MLHNNMFEKKLKNNLFFIVFGRVGQMCKLMRVVPGLFMGFCLYWNDIGMVAVSLTEDTIFEYKHRIF